MSPLLTLTHSETDAFYFNLCSEAAHDKRLKPAELRTGTHVILMQDLQDFIDVVQGVNSGGTSLFGLRKRKCSRDQLEACSQAN